MPEGTHVSVTLDTIDGNQRQAQGVEPAQQAMVTARVYVTQGVVQNIEVLVESGGLVYTAVPRILAEEPSRFGVHPPGAQVHELRVTRMSLAATLQEWAVDRPEPKRALPVVLWARMYCARIAI
jgi:hypothetical protein